ncbi:zinc finger CCHC-type and RNA-binding motif-containing protein 1-like isoform X1 [Anneissia japonica]|uniref:zinc finger CCHC-type and RNA-binding motif-containing protein 1-like isoform X1 n=1 Tax=Anneissia japonica TaxID=1529436 RepID=UPI001425A23F|nr:zinc finger CCHC-type and RNA-binding motif-containing protein 1-like isoform X1 [Anneissia japonica]XP_033095797.1 zinc finger CCHC-type and RNA-binding motif-containing protein 1-like isoform X1 [Anneissia japonica]
MSGGIAPSKTTVYVSNLPFSLTNNDLHKVFEKFGRVVKVTVVKDKEQRRSKGIAFVLFIDKESAHKAVRAINGKELFGRRWKCNMAADNGRASEFIRRKNYPDKSRCYECGAEGHLSYRCPSNSLGEREPPKKKEKHDKDRKRRGTGRPAEPWEINEEEEEQGEDPALDSLSAAISYEYDLREKGESSSYEPATKKLKVKTSAYFSDEEEVGDDGD